jgi:hypothetical protein
MKDQLKGILILAAPCGTIGGVLLQRGFVRAGWVFVALAIVVVMVALLSFLLPGLLRLLRFASGLVQDLGSRGLGLAAAAYRRCVMKLAEATLRAGRGSVPLSWTASQRKLYTSAQAADYMVLAGGNGQRLRGLEFSVRPDYRFQYWRAGFMLTPGDAEVGKGNITDTCLFHIWMNSSVEQPSAVLFLNGRREQDSALQHYSREIPAFVVRANVWPTGNTVARMAVWVDNAGCFPS